MEEGTVKFTRESTSLTIDNCLLYLDPNDMEAKKNYGTINLKQEAPKALIPTEKKQ